MTQNIILNNHDIMWEPYPSVSLLEKLPNYDGQTNVTHLSEGPSMLYTKVQETYSEQIIKDETYTVHILFQYKGSKGSEFDVHMGDSAYITDITSLDGIGDEPNTWYDAHVTFVAKNAGLPRLTFYFSDYNDIYLTDVSVYKGGLVPKVGPPVEEPEPPIIGDNLMENPDSFRWSEPHTVIPEHQGRENVYYFNPGFTYAYSNVPEPYTENLQQGQTYTLQMDFMYTGSKGDRFQAYLGDEPYFYGFLTFENIANSNEWSTIYATFEPLNTGIPRLNFYLNGYSEFYIANMAIYKGGPKLEELPPDGEERINKVVFNDKEILYIRYGEKNIFKVILGEEVIWRRNI